MRRAQKTSHRSTPLAGERPRVLRVSHSSVVESWRERDRSLRRRGIDVRLVTAARWNEGGALVTCHPGTDDFVTVAKTFGHHPNLFLFDPRPLWRLTGADDFDLVDLHEEPYGLAAAEVVFLCWLRGRMRRRRPPVVVSSAQNVLKRFPPPFRWTERLVLARAAGVYACNHDAADIVCRKGFTGIVSEVPLGVDVDHFRPADREPPRRRLRVGYVGRLTLQKGVTYLLDAVAGDQRLELELYGSGPEEEHVRARCATLAIEDRVSVRGHVDASMLPAVYRRFDVLAVPSLALPGLVEQFGRVVVEAQASGVPVVASSVGALPDVVGDAGLLVRPADPHALGAALARVLDEEGLWTDLRSRGLANAQRYSWAAVADLHLELYRRVWAAVDQTAGLGSAG
ncbi:MAG: glycosyltransferase [Actinomycetota bacterium]|nr:glycosyltransferase [Actinomycetota bacterium]